MSTALALRENSIEELQTIGQVFVKSGFFAETRDAAQAIVKIMAGAELGFPPIASMTGVYIVKGRVSLSANLMAAAIKRSGKYNYKVRELSTQAAEIEFFEGGESIGKSRFTMVEAKGANMADGPTWQKFPRNMLFARAMSNGAKWYCPDIFGGPIYTPEELGATVDGETGEVIGMPVEAEPEPAGIELREEVQEVIQDALTVAAVRSVKLEGAQPTDGEWDAFSGLKGGAGFVVKLAQKLKWTQDKVAKCVEDTFKTMVAPGKLKDYLEFATKDELRELYRVMNS